MNEFSIDINNNESSEDTLNLDALHPSLVLFQSLNFSSFSVSSDISDGSDSDDSMETYHSSIGTFSGVSLLPE
jgi:hypothetical protein